MWHDLRRFCGWTILLAVVYAPIVAYTLWLHFRDYAGPGWLLTLPIVAALLSGFADRKLSVVECAVFLSGTAYAVAVIGSLCEIAPDLSKWYQIPLTILFAGLWFATFILSLTLILVMVGHVLRSRVSKLPS